MLPADLEQTAAQHRFAALTRSSVADGNDVVQELSGQNLGPRKLKCVRSLI